MLVYRLPNHVASHAVVTHEEILKSKEIKFYCTNKRYFCIFGTNEIYSMVNSRFTGNQSIHMSLDCDTIHQSGASSD